MPSSDASSSLFGEFPPVSTNEWEQKIREDLGLENPAEMLEWDSIEGISLPAYLRRTDLHAVSHVSTEGEPPPLSSPETPPNHWRVRQNLRHHDLQQAIQHARAAVEGGCTDLGLVLNAGTKRPEGLPIESPDDLEHLLANFSSSEVHLHLERGPAAVVLFGALRHFLNENQGEQWSGSVAYDPVGTVATGTLRNASAAFDLSAELVQTLDVPNVRALSVDLRPYHDAGASAVQELACALGALCETLSQLLERGVDLPTLLSHLQVLVSTSTSYFVEVAKLRALRLLLPQVIGAFASETGHSLEFGPADLFVQAETSRRTETLYDPHVNLLRGTTAGMSAVIGGCDVLTVRSYDAPFGSTDHFGARIARNVQLILKHEAHFDVVSDPAAGSYYVETATDRLAQQAWSQFQEMEQRGGILEALREERLQNRIAHVRKRRRKEVDARERVLVGTNHYPDLEEQRWDEDNDFFSCNNGTKVGAVLENFSLSAIQSALDSGRKIPSFFEAFVEDPNSFEPLPQIRLARGIERTRLRTERHATEHGRRPIVFLAPLGPAGARSARSTFARNVFGVAGFEVHEHLKFDSPTDVGSAAASVEPDVLVICSADAEYSELVPAVRSSLEDRSLRPLLVVAGHPDEIPGSVAVDEFVHRKQPLRETLEHFQRRLGVLEESTSPNA